MKRNNKGSVLIEVLLSLFITAVVFIAVYTTIAISLINTKYSEQRRSTAETVSYFCEALLSSADCEEYSVFDYIKENYGNKDSITKIDLKDAENKLNILKSEGNDVVSFTDLIEKNVFDEYNIELYLISPNAVYLNENSLGMPFGTCVYTPDSNLLTFEIRVQKNSDDWGQNGYSFYRERKPAVISYILQINRRTR